MIDTHAHLNFKAFENDCGEVIKRAKEAGIEAIINVGSNLETSERAVELAQKFDCCFAAVGVHPIHWEVLRRAQGEFGEEGGVRVVREKLKNLAKAPKVVAVGETGLDYYRNQVKSAKLKVKSYSSKFKVKEIEEMKKRQKELFKMHLELAEELGLPVIIHNREAHEDVLEIIRQYEIRDTRYGIGDTGYVGVFHCFSGTKEFLKKVLEMGFYVGFDGNITYKTADDLRELVKATPLSRLLLETDCPYLTPEPPTMLTSRRRLTASRSRGAQVRGKPFRYTRNEPKNVKIIGEFVAKLKNVDFNLLKRRTTKNAKILFKV